MKIYFFLFIFFITVTSFAQKNFTISGYISDKATGERLINASFFELETFKGTITNNYGYYSLSLPDGKSTLIASFIGYSDQIITIDLKKDFNLNIELKIKSDELDEVVVVGNQTNNVENTQMSMIDLPIQKLQKIPIILGEADVLKVIQLLPGVQSGTEGTSGIYVRGGGPDQNLFLLDGVPVYNASHLLGFFSVFNPDAIKTAKLYKGGFPARFGGRLSSVVDISMKDGNRKELKGNFSIGLISAKLQLEGPIINDKNSFMISARRTYIDALARPVMALMDSDSKTGAYFHDFNIKLNHIFSDKSRLYWSGYHGMDKANIYNSETYNVGIGEHEKTVVHTNEFDLGWGNTISSLRWNYIITPKLFTNTTLSYSKYFINIGSNYETNYIASNLKEDKIEDRSNYFSSIRDICVKVDFDFSPSPKHIIKFGSNYTNHFFSPGVSSYYIDNTQNEMLNTDTIQGNRDISANEFSLFIEDDVKITNKLKLNAGIHFSLFAVDNETFLNPQPRISVNYKCNENWALKGSYSRMAQHVHLLSSSGIGLPSDLWVPVTKQFTPPISDQLALGVAHYISNGMNITIEGFYKKMQHLIEYKDGATFSSNDSTTWEDKVDQGRGWSYGLEILLEKSIGKTTGWIGYTWSKNERQFDNINFGRVFPAKYDRRHDISVVLTHKFNDRFDVGATWVYSTGNTATIAFSQYPLIAKTYVYSSPFPDNIYYISGRNNYRLPSNHRLDLGANFHKEKRYGIRTWSISVYNVYNHLNPFMLYWKEDYNNPYDVVRGDITYQAYKKKLTLLSIFPVIPSISYSFKF